MPFWHAAVVVGQTPCSLAPSPSMRYLPPLPPPPFFGSSDNKLPELAHQKALEKALGIKDQSCPVLRLSHKTVADITHCEDELYLIPGNAAGTATPEGIPVCYRRTRQTGRLSKSQRCATHRKGSLEDRGLHGGAEGCAYPLLPLAQAR